jgi:hypothetical protein
MLWSAFSILVQHGRRQTDASRKLRVRRLTAAFAQKFAKLTCERGAHMARLTDVSFRMWNICWNFSTPHVRRFSKSELWI